MPCRFRGQYGHDSHVGFDDQGGHDSHDGFDGQYGHDSQDGHNSHDKFLIPGQAGKGLILSEDLLLADASMTTKRMELFSAKEDVTVTLEAYD